jgi:hypothetical protein
MDKRKDIGKLSLRGIAGLIGCPGKPQIVKHHLSPLVLCGLVKANKNGELTLTKDSVTLLKLIDKNKSLFDKIWKLYK